jgi:hypothetical protein
MSTDVVGTSAYAGKTVELHLVMFYTVEQQLAPFVGNCVGN